MPRLGWRWALVAARVLAILSWFLVILPFHAAACLARRRDLSAPLFLRGVGWLAGLRVRRSGRPAAGPLLIVANHVSWLDILALAGAAQAAFAAHAGLARFGMLRWLCLQNDTVFIARDSRATVGEQVRQIEAALAHRRVVVFAEGTTSDGRALLPFKSALLAVAERAAADMALLRVQPVALAYGEAPAIAWAGAEPGMHNVLRILARLRPVRLTVHFCPPLEEDALAGRKAMAGAAQAAVGAALRL